VPQRDVRTAAIACAWAALGLLFMLIFGLLARVSIWVRVFSWEEVPCRVLSAYAKEAEDPEGTGQEFRVYVEYEYQFGGKAYHSARWRPGQPFFGVAYSKPAGRTVEAVTGRLMRMGSCYVNPREPSEAVLEHTFPLVEVLGCVFMTLICLLPGTVVAAWALRAR